MQVGEVVDTVSAYNRGRTWLGFKLPLGAIKVRMDKGIRPNFFDSWCLPGGNVTKIPLLGEHVIVYRGPGKSSITGGRKKWSYYVGPIRAMDSSQLNVVPQTFLRKAKGVAVGAFLSSAGYPDVWTPISPKYGETFWEKDTVKTIQPYEGDVILEGRYGSALRFGSTIKRAPKAIKGMGQHKNNPKGWDEDLPKGGNPITIITNGFEPNGGPNEYQTEDFDKDSSTLIMTTKQKLKLKTAQKNYGTKGSHLLSKKVEKVKDYKKPQVVLTSDRLMFNAKKDFALLIAKKDIVTDTPNWSVALDLFFTNYLDFMEEMIKHLKEDVKHAGDNGAHGQASAASLHPTPCGPSGPPTNAGSFISHKAKCTSTKSKLKQIQKKVEQLKKDLEKMKQ